MSGDKDPRFVVRACEIFCQRQSDVHLILVGNEDVIQNGLSLKLPNLSVIGTTDVVAMTDKPAFALRNKRDSSMSTAIKLHADKQAEACWSAGNTGALMAFGLYWLKTTDGIERPAICKAVPTSNDEKSFLLDIGANTDCTPQNLLQFAQLGHQLASQSGIACPKIALLNVGTEVHKGGQLQKEAEALIKADTDLNYLGFIESDALFDGEYHVIVCDGFTGNAVLKACEGTATFMLSGLKKAFQKNGFTRFLSGLARGVFGHWQASYNPEDLNGAVFLGLNGIVVKSHGGAEQRGLLASLKVAYDQAVYQRLSN